MIDVGDLTRRCHWIEGLFINPCGVIEMCGARCQAADSVCVLYMFYMKRWLCKDTFCFFLHWFVFLIWTETELKLKDLIVRQAVLSEKSCSENLPWRRIFYIQIVIFSRIEILKSLVIALYTMHTAEGWKRIHDNLMFLIFCIYIYMHIYEDDIS